MTEGRYRAESQRAEFEPGSRGRVSRNLLGIRLVRDMQQAESDALRAGGVRWPSDSLVHRLLIPI